VEDEPKNTDLSTRRLYKRALKAHRRDEFEAARMLYEKIVERGDSRYVARSQKQLRQLDRGKPPKSGRMGFVALGVLLLFEGIRTLVPPPHSEPTEILFIFAGFAILVGVVWSLFQSGAWNKVAGALTLVLSLVAIAESMHKSMEVMSDRNRISGGLSLASPRKIAVTDFYAAQGRLPDDDEEVGIASPEEFTGDLVKSVTVSDGGKIIVTFKGKPFDGKTMELKPTVQDGTVRWVCLGGNLRDGYRPSSCR